MGRYGKTIESTKEIMTKELNAQKETVQRLENQIKEEHKTSANTKMLLDNLIKEKEELASKLTSHEQQNQQFTKLQSQLNEEQKLKTEAEEGLKKEKDMATAQNNVMLSRLDEAYE